MNLKSIIVAVILLALLFGWYAWLEISERRRRRRVGETRSPFHDRGAGDAQGAKREGELWKTE